MKKLIPLLVLSLLLCGCAQEEPENPYRLKTQTYVSYYDTEVNERSTTYFYDEQGRISGYESNDGDIAQHTYDEYGNLIRTEIKGPDGTDVVAEYVLTLDEQHRPIRSEHYWNGELGSTTVYGYDKHGNVIQLDINRMLPDENIQSWVTMEYDWHGNLIREETKWSHTDGGYTVYDYEDGHLSHIIPYDMDGNLQNYSVITWDEATRTETRNNYQANGEVNGHSINYYDEFGNCLKTEHYNGPDSPFGGRDDVVDRIVTYTYELIPQ